MAAKQHSKQSAANVVTVKPVSFGSRQWGVFVRGVLVEGGFFSRTVAEDAARRIARELAEQAAFTLRGIAVTRREGEE